MAAQLRSWIIIVCLSIMLLKSPLLDRSIECNIVSPMLLNTFHFNYMPLRIFIKSKIISSIWKFVRINCRENFVWILSKLHATRSELMIIASMFITFLLYIWRMAKKSCCWPGYYWTAFCSYRLGRSSWVEGLTDSLDVFHQFISFLCWENWVCQVHSTQYQ